MKHDKYFDGHVTITLKFPLRFKVDAEDVEYLDNNGNSYFEEEWEYGPEEILKQSEQLKQFVKEYKDNIEEIVVEEI